MVIAISGWELVAAGAIGGVARTAYAALMSAEKRRTVNLWLFLISIITGAFIGAVIAALFKQGSQVSALAGYVGTNLLDNVIQGVVPKSLSI